jgi:hypothetical protein
LTGTGNIGFLAGLAAAVISVILGSCIPPTQQPPCFDGAASGDDTWSDTYLGSDTTVPYFPDAYSNYWVTSFDLTAPDNIGFRIHGEFAYARYMSYNIYDATVGTPLSGLLDRDIQANCQSVNPFDGGNGEAEARSYLMHIVPRGTPTAELVNAITYDPAIDDITIILRYYIPEGDETGLVELPVVEAFDPASGSALSLPPASSAEPPDIAEFEDRLNDFFATQIDGSIRFYNISSANLFANLDNKYLAAAVDRSDGRLAAIRFKPPIMADAKEEIAGAQVRYWSLNLGGLNTSNYAGIKDVDVVGNEHDWVYFIFGDAGDTEVMQVALENGYNFIPWNVPSDRGIIIYRNLVTRDFFDGDIDRVPVLDGAVPINVLLQQAQNFIGPYAPRGKRVDRAVFLTNPGSIF